jgi:hypothetical protein
MWRTRCAFQKRRRVTSLGAKTRSKSSVPEPGLSRNRSLYLYACAVDAETHATAAKECQLMHRAQHKDSCLALKVVKAQAKEHPRTQD